MTPFARLLTRGPWMGLAALAVLLMALPCSAQRRVAATPKQIELNNLGLDAQDAGNHALAAEKFREALDLAELNLIYLNLGRALQKSGDCLGADDAYRAALTAPKIDQPSPAVIERTISGFRAEMNQECNGAVVVQCDKDNVGLEIAGRTWECNRPISMAPGVVEVAASYDGKTERRKIRVVSMEGSSVAIDFGTTTQTATTTTPSVTAVPAANPRESAAIGLFGAGGALIFSGVVFTFLTVQANSDIVDLAASGDDDGIDSIQATDAVGRSRNYELAQFLSYGTGLACLATAFTLYYWDGISDTFALGPVRPAITPDGAHVILGFDY